MATAIPQNHPNVFTLIGKFTFITAREVYKFGITRGKFFRQFSQEFFNSTLQVGSYNFFNTQYHIVSSPSPSQFAGGFVQLERLSWSDKLAVDNGVSVNGTQRWKTLANDKQVRRLTRLLTSDQMSPGQFLEAVSWVNIGALNQGLKLDRDTDSESDSCDDD